MEHLEILDTDTGYNHMKKNIEFRKLFVIEVSINNGKGLQVLQGKEIFSSEDLKHIITWVEEGNHRVYKENFYRLNLNNYILYFKKKYDNNMLYLVGHVLKQTNLSRLFLLELREQYLRELIN
jgi:hypothetical protein